jgi:hypothetical protein
MGQGQIIRIKYLLEAAKTRNRTSRMALGRMAHSKKE